MQFDLADRVIQQFTAEGETVFDPFGGLMTVPSHPRRKCRKGRPLGLASDYGTYTVPVNGSLEMWWQESKLSGAADLDNGDVARDLGESI